MMLIVGSQVASDNNGVTGLSNSYPRVITAWEILLELVYPLYGTIAGSLNISLSNNPVFLEGHFVRVEPLEVLMSVWLPLLSACNL